MTQRVIHVLEVIEVDIQDRERIGAAPGAGEGLTKAFDKGRPVRKSGERILVGEVVDLLPFFDMINRERDVAGQVRQQLHLFFMEEFTLARVQREHPYGFIRNNQR